MSRDFSHDELLKRIGELESKLKERAKRIYEKDKSLSDEQYSYLVELSIEAVLQCNSQGEIIVANSKFLHLCGYSADMLPGMKISSLCKKIGQDQELQLEELKRGSDGIVLCRKDGSQIHVELLFQHLPNNAYQIIIKDVSEKVESEASILELEETLRLIFENSSDGICYYQEFNNKKRLIDCNKYYLENSGFTKEELINSENISEFQRILSPPDENGRVTFSWLRPDNLENIIEHTAIQIKRRKINYVIGIDRNITAKTQAEMAFRLDELRLEAILKLYQMENVSLPEIINYALNEGVSLTQSKYGYIAFVSEDQKVLNMYSWSDAALKQCKVDNRTSSFKIEDTGLWGEAIRQRKPIITNNYAEENLLKRGIPKGHIEIERHMNIPVFNENKIVIVAGVANKLTNYNESDIRQLNLLMTGLWNILKKRQMEIDIRQSKERLQSLYDLIQNDFENEKELVEYALEKAVLLSGSKTGYFYHIDPAYKNSNLFVFCDDNNNFIKKHLDISFIEKSGIINECSKVLKPVVENNFNDPGSNEIEKHLSIPVLDKNKLVVIAGVANKKENYDANDTKQLERYLQEVWKIILRMRNDITLKENEAILRQQNEEFIAVNEELNESNLKIRTIIDELQQAKQKAEESDRLKTSFLANMSHEIRTPMNAITGFAELLRQPGIDSNTINQYVEIIFSNSQQLLALIDDIIDISRIEAEKVSIKRDIININKVLDEVAFMYRGNAFERGLEFNLKTALEDEKAYVITDESRLRQILNNLLNNAIKFTHEGSISLGYNIYNQYLEFYVSDTGIGIAQEHFDLIFERFRQVETGLSRKYGGTGLGLTISKFLVGLLGGKIWLSSQIDIGTTFYFTIPLVAPEVIIEPEQSEVVHTSYSWSGKTILIAEDEEFNFYYVHEILAPTNVKLLRAKTGKEAVDSCKSNPEIDLVLMDIKMPEMDGYEATKLIKLFRPGLPVIAQTAHAMSEDMAKSINAGCDNYVTKPIHKEHLLKLIHEKIGKK